MNHKYDAAIFNFMVARSVPSYRTNVTARVTCHHVSCHVALSLTLFSLSTGIQGYLKFLKACNRYTKLRESPSLPHNPERRSDVTASVLTTLPKPLAPLDRHSIYRPLAEYRWLTICDRHL